ncbi:MULTISPECIES: pyridoxal phosphate-dependent aminotransferase family protein [unclassified Streptomyces]|uniref:aminotransferase class I/II-fold pyridoxal phosphate-dependent enzyme n=1 Tax=unclassified Streptomyces TaxID=2593676 RepID=UPI0034264188
MTTTGMDFGPALNGVLDTVDRWQEQGHYPLFPVISEPLGTRARLADGRVVSVFGSCDYLGLSKHPAVVEAALNAVHRFGTHCYGTQPVGGFTELHRDLETSLAEYFGKPAAALFPTGMQANIGVLTTLAGPGDAVLTDQLNHGSITMGGRLSGARLLMFRHNDLDDLAVKLAAAGDARRRIIVVDGLFSADGDFAPLAGIAELADRHGALLIVDEAHAGGTVGAHGRGAAELMGVLDRVDVITGTMSKAFASTGGFACGSDRAMRLVRHAAGAYLLSLGLAPATVGASLAAVHVASAEGVSLRARNAANAKALRDRLQSAGVNIGASAAHVVLVHIGRVDDTARIATRLLEDNLLVNPLFPPAVPIGGARLRIGVTSAHSKEEIISAADAVASALKD